MKRFWSRCGTRAERSSERARSRPTCICRRSAPSVRHHLQRRLQFSAADGQRIGLRPSGQRHDHRRSRTRSGRGGNVHAHCARGRIAGRCANRTVSVMNGGTETAKVTLVPSTGGISMPHATLTNLPASPTLTINNADDAFYQSGSQQVRVVEPRQRSARQ
jgi:hypothetical protein